jgi:histidinol-phosphate aminotransferase
VYQAYISPGDGVVMLDPSYAMFPVYAQMFSGEAVLVPYDRDLQLDTGLLLRSIVPGVRLIMLANPNQPTGTLLDEDVLLEVIERANQVGALVAMDEAYYPFGGVTALPWLETHSNLLVIRTFSKAAGLAGLRVGFVAGHPEVIANLYKVHTVNDLNSMSVLCASQVLKHPEVIDDYVTDVEAGNRVLAAGVPELGITVVPTHANFALLRVAHRCKPADLVESLKRRGYLVKAMDSPCVADCIRVTVGPADLMAGFVRCLGQALESDF